MLSVSVRVQMKLLVSLFGLTLNAWPQPEWPRLDTAGFLPAIRAQFDEAKAAAVAHPRDPKAVGRLALALHAYQQYDAAARVYARLRLLEPQDFDWLYLLGAVQKTQGAFEAAIDSFRSALRIRPDDLAAELRL